MNTTDVLRKTTKFVNSLEHLLKRKLKRKAMELARDWYSRQRIDGRQCEIVLRDVLLEEREDIKEYKIEHICGGCCYHILQYLANCEESYLDQTLGYSWYHQFRVIDKLFDYEELVNMEPFAPNMLFNPKFGHSFIISVEKRNELLKEMNGLVNLNYLNGMTISVELVNGNIGNVSIELTHYLCDPDENGCKEITNVFVSDFKNKLKEKAKHRPNILTKGAVEHMVNEYIAELMWIGLNKNYNGVCDVQNIRRDIWKS